MLPLTICSLVNYYSLEEFLLFKFSVEQFQKINWLLITDNESKKYLDKFPNIESDALLTTFGDQFSTKPENIYGFSNVVKFKPEVCRRAINKCGYALFIDCDMVFINHFDDDIYQFIKSNLDVAVSIHLYPLEFNLDNVKTLNPYEIFNTGMMLIKSQAFINEWEEQMTWEPEHYDQLAFEKVLFNRTNEIMNNPFLYYKGELTKKYKIDFFSHKYNIGWWRFKPYNHKIKIREDWRDNVKNLHVHAFLINNEPTRIFFLNRLLTYLTKTVDERVNKIYKHYCILKPRNEKIKFSSGKVIDFSNKAVRINEAINRSLKYDLRRN